ncbi:hypothetical protein BD410DRAFT_845670 [Rickenella mellea]|uniref:Ubiquitin-like protease family profile domain-containing protein n=1 Tax=Rickenella mellea TaxID=50990 RepID=A0A4Y7PHA6_9AGAM|nr:hypothetical protein BD410DRAFT_845670 [Rickenella mellea]
MAAPSETFIPKLWINCGKKFSKLDLPDHVEREWDRLLAIPTAYQDAITNRHLTVSTLLQHTSLPCLDNAAVKINTNECFSKDPPSLPIHPQFLKRSIPPHPFLLSLLRVAGQAWLDGNQSVIDWRFNERLPFWVLTYWRDLARTVEARRDWIKADEFLKELANGSGPHPEKVHEFRDIFHSIGWGVPMRGAGEFLEMQDLVALVTGRWLKNEIHYSIYMEVMNLLRKLTSDSNAYPSRRFRSLECLGSDLASGRTRVLIFPVFVHENHWAVFSVNAEEETIRYSDSLDSSPQPNDLVVIKRWLAHHGFNNLHEGEPLAHAHQTDGFSCGPITANTIKHAVFGAPLWTLANREIYRLDLATKLIDSHLDSSDNDLTFNESKARSYPVSPPRNAPPLAVTTILSPSPPPIATDTGVRPKVDPNSTQTASSKEKIKIDLRSEPNAGGLFKHFNRLSREEWTEWEAKRDARAREEAKLQQEDRESLKEQRALDEILQKEQVRAGNRERKRCERERKKEARNIRSTSLGLHDSLSSTPTLSMSIAEVTRPKRSIIANLPTDAKGRGRKRKRDHENAVRVNWQLPLTWAMILEARVRVRGWSPREITNQAKRMSPAVFSGLNEQVLGRWIQREPVKGETGPLPRWKKKVLDRAEAGIEPGGQFTRTGVLADYPELIATILRHFENLREAGISISVVTARGIIIAMIEHHAPEVFTRVAKDGSVFRCCDSWVKKFLRANLRWVMRSSTRAAQKIPLNTEEQIRHSFLRHVLTF